MEEAKKYINGYIEGDISESEFIDFITNAESDMYSGTNTDGNTIIVGIQKGAGVEIQTHQDNGWIRINSFEIVEDSEGNPYIQKSERYDK